MNTITPKEMKSSSILITLYHLELEDRGLCTLWLVPIGFRLTYGVVLIIGASIFLSGWHALHWSQAIIFNLQSMVKITFTFVEVFTSKLVNLLKYLWKFKFPQCPKLFQTI
jgi:hypothetical protein